MCARFGLMTVILLSLLHVPACASGEEKPLWELGAGLAFIQLPDYRGSDENRLYALPYPYFVYRGDTFKVDRQNISGRIFKTDRVLLDMSLFGGVPVNSSGNTARRGMRDLDATFEFGPSLKVKLFDKPDEHYTWNLSLPVRAVFSTDFSSIRSEGWIFSPKVNFEKGDLIPHSGVNLGISAGPTFADSAFNSYYYSVDQEYATASRPAYSAAGGYIGSLLTIGLNKSYGKFLCNAFISIDFLEGSIVEDSPLMKTKYSLMSGIAISWIFKKSEKLVTGEK
jgi:MipA family protein